MFGRENKKNRDAWIAARLQELPNGWTILDAGAGEQQYRQWCKHLTYVSQDFCKYDGTGNKSGLQTGSWDCRNIDIVCDICSIPLPNESFDAILCTEVLEHLPQPLEAIRELCRLLRPGGRLILTAPFCSLTHFSPYFFSTGFSKFFYEETLPKYGMAIIELSSNGNYFEYLAQELFHIPRYGKMYSSRFMGWLALAMSAPLLPMLYLLSLMDRGSSESLCFGWHVVAEKKNIP